MAALIVESGVDKNVNVLEYWGDDPVTRARLKPLSAAVVKLFAAAGGAAEMEFNKLIQLDLNNERIADKLGRLDTLAQAVEYNRNMSIYFDCLATGPDVLIDAGSGRVLTPPEIAAATRRGARVLNLSQIDGRQCHQLYLAGIRRPRQRGARRRFA